MCRQVKVLEVERGSNSCVGLSPPGSSHRDKISSVSDLSGRRPGRMERWEPKRVGRACMPSGRSAPVVKEWRKQALGRKVVGAVLRVSAPVDGVPWVVRLLEESQVRHSGPVPPALLCRVLGGEDFLSPELSEDHSNICPRVTYYNSFGLCSYWVKPRISATSLDKS